MRQYTNIRGGEELAILVLGWTPAGQELLYRRLAGKGIPWLPYEVVVRWASEMKSLGTTMVFNREDWGLGGVDIRETRPTAL